jgi:DNA polymerase III delta prime subunit
MSGVDYTTVGMSPSEVRRYITNSYLKSQELGWERPDSIYIEGPPGVGKTYTVYAAAKDIGAQFRECSVKSIMMSAIEPTDIVGTPWRHAEHPYTSYMPLKWAWEASVEYENFRKETDPDFVAPPMFLFFDDFVVAHEQVQAAGHKLFHEGMAGDLTIRPNVLLIAAGNRPEDNAAACEMKTAMASRFRWIYFHLTSDDWLKWARHEGKIHPLVSAYIQNHRDALHNFDPDAAEKAFACPRTWEMLSRAMFENDSLVKEAVAAKENTVDQDFFKISAGIVGSGSAVEFSGFMDRTANAIPVDVILKNPKKAPYPKVSDIDALHATMESLGFYIKNEKPEAWKAGLIYATRDDHPLSELAIVLTAVVADTIINHLPEDDRLEAFRSKEFEIANEKYGKYITAMCA